MAIFNEYADGDVDGVDDDDGPAHVAAAGSVPAAAAVALRQAHAARCGYLGGYQHVIPVDGAVVDVVVVHGGDG